MNPTNWTLKTCVFVITFFSCLLFIGCQALQHTEAISPGNEQNKRSDNYGTFEDDPISVDDIKKARSLWLEKKIADYDMVVRYEPHGQLRSASPVLIKVRNSKAVSIEPISDEVKGTLVFYANFGTVDKMLDRIQEDLEKGANVTGSLHPELGYPERIFVTPKLSDAYYRLRIDRLEAQD